MRIIQATYIAETGETRIVVRQTRKGKTAMKFKEPKCPECGKELRGMIETLQGVAELEEQEGEPGVFEYSGSTDLWWDEQRPVRDHRRRVELVCHDAHEWFSEVTDDGRDDYEKPDEDALYRDAARELFHSEGEIEIDPAAPVSKGDDDGAYVQAWVWVPDSEIPGRTPAEKKQRQGKKKVK